MQKGSAFWKMQHILIYPNSVLWSENCIALKKIEFHKNLIDRKLKFQRHVFYLGPSAIS